MQNDAVMDMYIYYQLAPAQADALQHKVRALQHGLAARFGVAAALKRRPQTKDGLLTWMEVYTAAPPEFAAALANQAAEAGISELIVGARHVEYFMDVAPCA